jgi:hypothetical protein
VITLQDRRVVCWIERGALFLLLAYLCVHTMPRAWGKLNTDFPNYYLSARLAHEGYDTSRMYEWTWLTREKDHRAMDIQNIGLLPITPFSTLVMWPLTGLSPLAAKHVWVLVNLALLVPLCWMLRSMTGMTYQRIALVLALSFPLHRNLLYGQFYIFLLFLIAAACWGYLRGRYALAGALVALAAACKIFPILFVAFFIQRRAWRALIATAVTGFTAIALSIAIFGWNVHRTYLQEILPWALHGEGLPPYATASASISSILHYLFLSEPQWNAHPWYYSPLCYALLQPALQTLALAPAILLIRSRDLTRERILLECSAILVASLAISTIPASYNFVLVALPVCVLTAQLLKRKWYGWLIALMIVYVGIGFPLPSPSKMMGPAILLYVPRLPLMLALLCGIYMMLWRERPPRDSFWDWTQYVWAAVLASSVVFSAYATLRRERDVRKEYAYRVLLPTQALQESSPMLAGVEVRYLAFSATGYHLEALRGNAVWSDPSSSEALSFTGDTEHTWVERALSPNSEIVALSDPSRAAIANARNPMLSRDRQSMAFLRNNYGRGELMVRRDFQSIAASDVALTPPSLNVYEASLLSDKEYAFSAVAGRHPAQIYLTDAGHRNEPLGLGESRYPALSPDGHWLAYSHFEHGAWNLWVRDESTGATRRITDLPCNQIQPAWEEDSKTLLYGSDCGRSLWFTALARRRVIP